LEERLVNFFSWRNAMETRIFSLIRILACGVAVACAFEAPALAQPAAVLYGTNEIGNQTYLNRIDPATGLRTQIGPIGFDFIRSMDADPVSGVMYATAARVVDVGSVEFILLTIDLATGQGTEVMSLGVRNGPTPSRVAVRPSDGTIFVGWQSSGFGQVDPPDDVDPVPGHPIFPVDAFDFDSHERLWGTFVEGNIFCIEGGSGPSCNVTEVFLENDIRVRSMAFEPVTDILYVIGDGGPSARDVSHFYTLDPNTGALALVAAFLRMDALAWHTPVDINTPTGEVVPVTVGPVSLTFTDVTRAGMTTVTMATSGPTPPAGFRLGDPPIYFDIATTAVFEDVTICINYTGISYINESSLSLWHFEEGDGWVDRTETLDAVNNIICAEVGSLSPFAIFEPDVVGDTTPPVLDVPDNIVTNATTPAGARVTFDASATDDSGGVTVQCLPASGSSFAIGTTTVSCVATDGSGNVDTAGFSVTVRGAAEQIVAMLERLRRLPIDPAAKARLTAALTDALAQPRNVARVCTALRLVGSLVRLSAGRSIPPDLAALLIADLNRIRAVLGCG
jgi:HYR domain